MSHRVGLRYLQNFRTAFRHSPATFRQNAIRGARFQTTDASAASAEKPQNVFVKLWNSPVGLKTVHFWAPIMKWGLVLAGISDMMRPAEKLSLTQNLALMATGAIWTRWCLIIKPRNLLLAAVNFFLACVGTTQVTRIFLHERRKHHGSSKEAAKDIASDTKESAKHVVEKVEGVVKSS
ncbi:hypothetical protein VTN49DRAFT_5444 [Thermomyces lanuginosus]|uniref:uncharacterized protein n=1 Tax=Thermomyces lanuginosus TaxID=5541 RepID=UPI003743889F